MARTALYRAFGDDEQLLYVGITNDPDRRWREHVGAKPWWKTDVRRIDVEWFDTRDAAARAESKAVSSERPRYNLTLPDAEGSFSYRLVSSVGGDRLPKPLGDADHTKPRQFRAPTAIWEAYGSLCGRLGTTRAADLNAHMRAQVAEHGTDQDRADLAAADTELERRRARVGGRPSSST